MPKPELFNILVADDHPAVREGLTSLINRQSDMHVVAEATNGAEAVEKFFALHPDIGLLDLRMPGVDGVDAVTTICGRDPQARLVVLTSFGTEEEIYRALRAGAQGYLMKTASREELLECLYAVGRGKTWIPPEVGAKLARRINDPQLTKRELDVLRAVVAGKSNKEIGVVYNISEGTVKVHMTHILEKLKVNGRTEAINVAARRGLVRIENNMGA